MQVTHIYESSYYAALERVASLRHIDVILAKMMALLDTSLYRMTASHFGVSHCSHEPILRHIHMEKKLHFRFIYAP